MVRKVDVTWCEVVEGVGVTLCAVVEGIGFGVVGRECVVGDGKVTLKYTGVVSVRFRCLVLTCTSTLTNLKNTPFVFAIPSLFAILSMSSWQLHPLDCDGHTV